MAVAAKKKELSAEEKRLYEWGVNPLVWVSDIFGDNIRKASELISKGRVQTVTGLSEQQEQAFREMGLLVRAKLKAHVGAKMTEREREYAMKKGLSIMSGTGNGKDFFAALVNLWFSHVFQDARGVVTANTGQQLRNVLWAEIGKVMDLSVETETPRGKMPILRYLFEIQNDKFFPREKAKTKWFTEAVTISTNSSEQEQGEALGGRHENFMLITIDEASGVPEAVFKPIEGTLTGIVNLVLIIFNPTKSTGFAKDTQYKNAEHWVTLRWNSEECEFVSPEHIEYMRNLHGEDSPAYRIRVLGLPPIADKHTLIPWDWIEDAIGRPIEPLKEDFVVKGWDFGAGGDNSIIATRKGGKVYPFKKNGTTDSNTLTDWCYNDFVKDAGDIAFGDVIGLGWAVMGNLRKMLGSHKVRSVDSRKNADDSERFENKRAECYWNMREAFERKEISLPANTPKDVVDQLGCIRYNDDGRKVKIERKSKIKAEIGHSPDEADALAYTFAKKYEMRRVVDPEDEREERRRLREERYNGMKNSWMVA